MGLGGCGVGDAEDGLGLEELGAWGPDWPGWVDEADAALDTHCDVV